MVPSWLRPRTGTERLMYLAHPTRKHKNDPGIGGRLKNFAKLKGYKGINPFDLEEKMEDDPLVGRPATLNLDICIQRGCGVTGIFGWSEGVAGEVRDRLGWDPEKNIRVFRRDEQGEFDEKWDEEYERLKPVYGDLLKELRRDNFLLPFVGPSAAGKTYWIEKLKRKLGKRLERIKNVTTRSPRDDNDEKYYYIVTNSQFKEGIESGRFLEHDQYLGEYYGSSLDEMKSVLKSSNGIFALTPKGAKAIYECRFEINVAVILLKPESESVLRLNLERRGVTDREKQNELIQKAKDFVLPPEISHSVVEVTGTKKDEERILKVVEPLLK